LNRSVPVVYWRRQRPFDLNVHLVWSMSQILRSPERPITGEQTVESSSQQSRET